MAGETEHVHTGAMGEAETGKRAEASSEGQVT